MEYPAIAGVWDYCYNISERSSEGDLVVIVNKYGPFFGALDASNPAFKHLKGIYRGDCSKKPNHAIVVTGYNEKGWIIKNSWGEKWGDKGYFYLPRDENKCGINAHIGVPFIH